MDVHMQQNPYITVIYGGGGQLRENKSFPNFQGVRAPFSDKFERIINKTDISDVEKKELLALLKVEVDKIFSQRRFLGRGKSNSVYKIDDDYVIRIGVNQGLTLGDFFKTEKLSVADKLKSYFGRVYAKFGTVQILKNAILDDKALNAGVPIEMKKADKIIKFYRDTYLPEFASLPQQAFDNIANDFKILNTVQHKDLYYKFDVVNPNNFIKTNDTIRIVDNITFTETKDYNNLNKMLNVFTKSYGVNAEIGFDKAMVDNRKIIYKKCILAGEKHELPFYSEPEELAELKRCTKLAGIKEKFSDILEKLQSFREKYPNKNERLKAVELYLETL